MEHADGRNYKILELLGRGGFGKVYRARFDGPDGFTKDVAVKLLSDPDPPDEMLTRFRDESRMLGLVRDRAVVSVEPPCRLGGRWAVVMEYVDGVTASRLFRVHGPPPLTVTLELIQEVARALDAVYQQPGPEGEPLRLLHRDLKPGNIQVTPTGAVKILDFGNARADFANRESRTTTNIAGTYGYVAPERMKSTEVPAGDVYSLGMMMRRLLRGEEPDPLAFQEVPAECTDDPDLQRALEIVRDMVQPRHEDRPLAREVEDRCAALRRQLEGPSLRTWAEVRVPAARAHRKDELVGSVLSQTLTVGLPTGDRTTSSARRMVLVASLTSLPLLLAIVLVLSIGAVGAGAWYALSSAPEVAAAPVPAAPAAAPEPEPLPEPEPEPEPEPLPEPEPAPPPEPPPTPRLKRPAPAAPSGPLVATDFGSLPMGATVYVDGVKLGTTPLLGAEVRAGSHKVHMKGVGGSSTHTIEVVEGVRTRWIWKGGDTWDQVRR